MICAFMEAAKDMPFCQAGARCCSASRFCNDKKEEKNPHTVYKEIIYD
jgi:hypothetical protein